MARFGSLGTQYFDSAGDPLINGKIYFYESGTTTPKTTYADVALTIPNTNPVILDADGRQPNVFFDGVARGVLTANNDVQIEVRDPIGEGSTGGAFSEWVASITYSENDIVQGSNGLYYISLSNGNVGNDPTSSAADWSQLVLLTLWNANQQYEAGDTVVTANGELWKSVQAQNNNNPTTDDGTNWLPTTPVDYYQDTYFQSTLRYLPQATDESIDLTSGMYFTNTVSTPTTFTFDSPPVGFFGFLLKLTNGGSQTVNWPASVDWPGGTPPPLTTAGVDVLRFITDDEGVTWNGLLTDGDSK